MTLLERNTIKERAAQYSTVFATVVQRGTVQDNALQYLSSVVVWAMSSTNATTTTTASY